MTKAFDVAVMHDFYVDRYLHTRNFEGLLGRLRRKARTGGGGMHESEQRDVKGGNAVNLAHALAMLGLRTLLLTHTDAAHDRILREPFEGLDVEIRAKPGRPGLTVAFEAGVNVMLGDGGGAMEFGPELLTDDDWNALGSAKVVCSVNWAANSRGTDLLAALRARLGPDKTVFFDPADFRDRMRGYGGLLRRITNERLVDWMSLNDLEASATASTLGLAPKGDKGNCEQISKKLGVALDVHGTRRSVTASQRGVALVSAKKVKARRYTGAGDVWDAASLYGRVRKMEDAERLEFANTAAGLYLASLQPVPPTIGEIESALR